MRRSTDSQQRRTLPNMVPCPMAAGGCWFAGDGPRTVVPAGNLVLEWLETGGPAVVSRNIPGFGTSVICDLIPYELGGAVSYELASEGARCRLEIPSKWWDQRTNVSSTIQGAD